MKPKEYTREELKVLKEGLDAGRSIPEIAAELGRPRAGLYVRSIADGMRESAQRTLSKAERQLIRDEYPFGNTRALAKKLNMSVSNLYGFANRMGYRKQKRPKQVLQPKRKVVPIGGYRIMKDPTGKAYLMVRVAHTGSPTHDYQAMHRLVWEQTHGAIPDDHVVRFKDGTRPLVPSEITLDKLECISKAENMSMNTIHRYPEELVEVIMLRGRLVRSINKRTKDEQQRHPQQD